MPAVQRSCDRLFREEAGEDRALKLSYEAVTDQDPAHCNFSAHEGVL